MTLRLLPRTLAARILLALILTLGSTIIALVAMLQLESRHQEEIIADRTETRIAGSLARVLLTTEGETERDALLTRMRADFPFFDAGWTTEAGYAQPGDSRLQRLQEAFPPGFVARTAMDAPTSTETATRVIINPPTGRSLSMSLHFGELRFFSWSSAGLMLLALIVLIVMMSWMAHGLAHQLEKLAASTTAFVPGQKQAPLRLAGPTEVRELAQTLNDMQVRITELMASQAIALRAVGHDLKTPITRMRTRIEKVDSPDVRMALERDLTYMDEMASDVLMVLDNNHTAKGEATDIASVLEAVCEDFSELGAGVTYTGPERLVMNVRSEDIARIVTNLLSNAVRHADKIAVTLSERPRLGYCTIVIGDNGPGLNEATLKTIEQEIPSFPRAGVQHGLGLFIANNLATKHRGKIEFGRSILGGLQVRVTIGDLGNARSP